MALTPELLDTNSPLVLQIVFCPFCGDSFQPANLVIICPVDHTPHHAHCWEANSNRCATPDCSGTGKIEKTEHFLRVEDEFDLAESLNRRETERNFTKPLVSSVTRPSPQFQSNLRPPAATQTPPPIFRGEPTSSSAETPTIDRHGRIEFFSPMDKEVEYPLSVGLFLEKHDRDRLVGAKENWVFLQIAAQEDEPRVQVIPQSAYFRISPVDRILKVRRGKDVSVEFSIIPLLVPKTSQGECKLKIDFVYQGDIIETTCLDVQIQDQFQFGRLCIPHHYGIVLTPIGGTVGFIAAGMQLYDYLTPSEPLNNPFLSLAILFGSIVVLLFGIMLWRKIGKRSKKIL